MPDASTIIRQRQIDIRRELDRRGILLKQVSFNSGIPYATLLSYFPAEGSREPAMMPVSALYSLVGAVPSDLLSILLPVGHLIVAVPEAVDHDEIERAARGFLTTKGRAHRQDSPSGPDISDCEDRELRENVVALRAAVA